MRVAAERDALLRLMLRSNSTMAGRTGQRWSAFARRHSWAARWLSRPVRLLSLLLALRWPPGARVNPLFDEAWYREQYPDAPAGRRPAYRQYLRLSKSKDRDPNPRFDTAWYMAQNPDVRNGLWDPLDHYLYFGWREGRDPSADFDGFDYLRHHPDAVNKAENPLLHSMRAGPFEPADPASVRMPGPPPAIRRTLTHFRRYGLRPTLARIATELGAARGTSHTRAVTATLAISQHEPRRIKANLDAPREGTTEDSSALLMVGWAFSDRSEVRVSVFLDGVLVTEAAAGSSRADVGALYRNSPNARASGFSARLSLDSVDLGRHVLHVVIRDDQGAVRVLARGFNRVERATNYHHYYRRSLPTPEETALVRAATVAGGAPTIHLVILDGPERELRATLRSLERQDYPGLSCVVLSSRSPELSGVEGACAIESDPGRVLPLRSDPTRLTGFLEAGETLAPAALWRFARAAQQTDAALVYSDHDAIDQTGRHVDPWFVPDWSPDHLLAQDYVGGFYLVRGADRLREVLPQLGIGDTAWRYALLLALDGNGDETAHVPSVLWSRPVAEIPDDAAERELVAVDEALAARGLEAKVRSLSGSTGRPIRHLTWPLTEQPQVSVIIPTTGRIEFVREAIESLGRTAYPDLEVIFVDNSRGQHPDGIEYLRGQDASVLERNEPFNWAKLNNDGARIAQGELLLFLNDDVEAIGPDWITTMVRQATRPDVGAVGSLMLYPDGSIQHAGVFLVGHGGGAVHLFRGLDPAGGIYHDWHRLAREVTSVTGACMLVRRDVFEELGGFDEELAIVGNDVDLCLRIMGAGRRVVMEPQATLVHHESQSRAGVDHYPDEGRMWDRWADVLKSGDPHYNLNLSEDRADASPDWRRVEGRVDPITRADPSSGVNLVGYIRAEMGLGEAVRGEARALLEADVPFVILDHQAGTPARLHDGSWAHKVLEGPHFDTNILHINADLLPQALQQLPPGLTKGRRNVGFWTWELPEFPVEWRGSFSLVDEVWVPSAFVQSAIGAKAPVPVHVVPHAVRVPSGPFLGREHFDVPTDTFQFLAMYDTQSVMERKNPGGAIEAFMRAFEPDDDRVSLVLKVNSAGDREVSALRTRCAEYPNVRLITDVLSRHAVDSLMASSDSFISLHRSEGFGLPIAEAMGLGKPVIATGWSGNMDCMSDETAACVRYKLVELDRTHGPYRAGQRWAEPDVDDAAAWMRRLLEDGALAEAMGAASASMIKQRFGPSAVGALMAQRLAAATPRSASRYPRSRLA